MNSHGQCSIRCRTAKTPKAECECSCGGQNHGTTSELTEFGTVSLEDNAQHLRTNPFETIQISSEGIETETATPTLADSNEYTLADVTPGNRVDVYTEYADEGWKLHQKLEVEAVTSDGVVVTKPDGFSTVVPRSQIPVEQFTP